MEERSRDAFLYEHCDVPQGQSLSEWRTARAASPRRRLHAAASALASLASIALPGRVRSRR
jgi:hypothetical protein